MNNRQMKQDELDKRDTLMTDFVELCVDTEILKGGKLGPKKTPKQMQQALIVLAEKLNKI